MPLNASMKNLICVGDHIGQRCFTSTKLVLHGCCMQSPTAESLVLEACCSCQLIVSKCFGGAPPSHPNGIRILALAVSMLAQAGPDSIGGEVFCNKL